MTFIQARMRWKKLAGSGRPVDLKVAVLSTFTADPVEPYLGVALDDLGVAARVFVGPFNQIVQQCLSEESDTARLKPDVLVCWPRLEDVWQGRHTPLFEEPDSHVEDMLELAEACLEGARIQGATLVFVLPAVPDIHPLGIGDASCAGGVVATATLAREVVRRRLAGQQDVLILDLENTVRRIGLSGCRNRRLLAIAHIPYSEELFAAVGSDVARLVKIARNRRPKALVLSCDNTLWGGAVSQLGPDGVDLSPNGPGQAYRDFQQFLVEAWRGGYQLCVLIPGKEADTLKVFERRDMILKRDHVAVWQISSPDASADVRAVTEKLGARPEDVCFIASSESNQAALRESLPGAGELRMPSDPAEWLRCVEESGFFHLLPARGDGTVTV